MPEEKTRKWIHGLSWSKTELEAIRRGQGSEAYDHTYGEYPIPKVYRAGAASELRRKDYRKKMKRL